MAPLVTLAVLVTLCACAHAQYEDERAPRYIASQAKEPVTPVSILKQINRHNDDGSYTYGYEAADGSFKIETKTVGGEVKGKYGYKDDTGKLRVIEYGANKYGFQPSGEGITVAPPTLVDETARDRPNKGQNGRSQFRESAPQQQIDYDYEESEPAPRAPARPAPPQQHRPQPQPQPQPAYRPSPQPAYRPPQQQYRPQQQPQSAPTPPKPQFFPGAAPAPAPVDQNSFFAPAPQQRAQPRPKQEFRPAPQQDQFSQNFPPNNNQYQPQQRTESFSMLDQLLKEYALPKSNAAPLHDITFGSY